DPAVQTASTSKGTDTGPAVTDAPHRAEMKVLGSEHGLKAEMKVLGSEHGLKAEMKVLGSEHDLQDGSGNYATEIIIKADDAAAHGFDLLSQTEDQLFELVKDLYGTEVQTNRLDLTK
ncbi:hypothetical protein CYMTET_32898, partial [Cymbomonas tetramitiformis]